ncbi:hypothetical protein [Pelagibius litoralis]|uniref:hypothetical protein n=1 Tax=Pelagibius litoralis TaxID=374515 RepID=UPI003F585A26
MVRGHASVAGAKEGLASRLLAARGAGSPVKFTVSVMPDASRSSSTSPAAKRRTARRSKSLPRRRDTPCCYLLADKGYDTNAIRNALRENGVRAAIPPAGPSQSHDPLEPEHLSRARPHRAHDRPPRDQPGRRHPIRQAGATLPRRTSSRDHSPMLTTGHFVNRAYPSWIHFNHRDLKHYIQNFIKNFTLYISKLSDI